MQVVYFSIFVLMFPCWISLILPYSLYPLFYFALLLLHLSLTVFLLSAMLLLEVLVAHAKHQNSAVT